MSRIGAAREQSLGLPPRPAEHAPGRRVLIVEDQPWVAGILTALVQAAGCRVVGPCRDTSDAASRVTRCKVDLALIDAGLETADGRAFAAELADAGIPSIVMIDFGSNQTALHPQIEIIAKPFGEHALRSAIGRALSPSAAGA